MKYRYNIETGLVRIKTNTKKYVAGVLAGIGLVGAMAIPVFAASPPLPPVSDNASPSACFGQERAAYAKGGPNGVLAPDSNGSYISQRKGTNPANNADFIDTYCQ